MRRVCLSAAPLCALITCAVACDPGPTHILGRLPNADAGKPRDAQTSDAATSRDAEPRNDAQASCFDDDDCETESRPFCSEDLERCVECLYDRHCDDYEYCRDSTGTCVERR
jgi:hypothetical protein